VSLDTGRLTTMKIIHNFISNEEATTIKNYIFDKEQTVKDMGPDMYNGTSPDSLTGRFMIYNWLTSETCGSILIPKLSKLFPNLYIRVWSNIFRQGEGISPHHHDNVRHSDVVRTSGNLYLSGPEDSKTHYANSGPVDNKIGTLTIFNSRLFHWVEPNPTVTPRVSMAFDTFEYNPKMYFPNDRTFIPLGTHDD